MALGAVSLPRVFVSGVRSMREIAAALGQGLSAVGFVDDEGARSHVDSASARAIVRELPPHVLPVVVCTSVRRGHAEAALFSTGARALQIDGDEDPRMWGDLPFPLLVRLELEPEAPATLERWRALAAGFVLDQPRGPRAAGSEPDLGLATALTRLAPCLLAAGTDAESVEERIARVRPWGVAADAVLENESGAKDPARVRRFAERASSALAALHGT